MQVAEVKSSSSASPSVQAKRQPFFSKEGQDSFFSKSNETSSSFFSPTTIQPKLTIGQPNDKYEVEADAMADKVVQRLAINTNPIQPLEFQGNTALQTKPEERSEEEKIQEKEESDIQLKPIFESSAELSGTDLQLKPLGNTAVQEKCDTCEEEVQKKEEETSEIENQKPGIPEKPIVENSAADTLQSSLDTSKAPIKVSEPSMSADTTTSLGPAVQAKCEECEQEEMEETGEERELQRKEIADAAGNPLDDEENIQTQSENASGEANSNLQSRLSTTKGGGSPLSQDVNSTMGAAFGADFSNVRVHTGSEAVQMNKNLNAQAFTHGNDIYFNEGKYDTGSTHGNHLLAHELTHTVQQGAVNSTVRKKSISKGKSSVPDIQRLIPLVPAVVGPAVMWGGAYAAKKLVTWGLGKVFEREEDMVDYGAVAMKKILETPIDLMGQTKFTPTLFIERHLQTFGLITDWYLENKSIAKLFGARYKKEIIEGPKVNIKFGELGGRSGVPIRWYQNTQSYEMNPHFMRLNHPAFDTKDKKTVPFLALGIDKIGSIVYGGLASLPAGLFMLRTSSKTLMLKLMDKHALRHLVLGEDYNEEHFKEVVFVNDIVAGNLQFQLAGFQTIGGNQILISSFALINGASAWVGSIKTKIKGITDTKIPVERDTKSRISGRLDGLSLASDWNIKVGNFKATLEASFLNGLLDIRGDASYSSDRIPEASLTIWITTKRQAWEAAEKRLPPEAKIEDRTFTAEDELAVTGWGLMDIIIIKDKPQKKGKGGKGAKNDDNFLTGKVAAVVDPDGFLTMSGEIIIKNKIKFLEAIGGDLKDIYPRKRRRLAHVNVYPGILARVMGEASLQAGYQVGPIELYELSVKGIYSNNPNSKIASQLELTGRINGVAGLKAEGEIKGDVELRLGTKWDYLGISPAKVSFGINAEGILKAYMDFAPTIGVKKEKGKGKDPENIPKYFFKGKLTVGGELDLTANAIVELKVLGTGYEGKYKFLKRTVPGAALMLDWNYTFGDPITKETLQEMTNIKRGNYNPPKMMAEMFNEQKAKDTDQLKGGYKEGKKDLGTVDDEKIPIPEKSLPVREIQDDFKMLGTTHHLILYFDEIGNPPELKMATNPELILKKIEIARNRLADKLPNLDEDDKKLLENRLQDLDRIKRAANKVLKNAKELGVGMKNIKKNNIPGFEELGDLISDYGSRYGVEDLSGKLSENELPGTEINPFEIVWPKPASVDYQELYFGGRMEDARSQGVMKGLYSQGKKDKTGTKIKKYKPHETGTLAEGEKIGISRSYRAFIGRIIGPLSTEGTPGGDKLNRILKKYGFSPGRDGDGMDADHIIEIQFGGKDHVSNLWPLNSDVNQASGRTLKDAKVAYPKTGRKVKIKDLKKKMRKYYFKITKFEY